MGTDKEESLEALSDITSQSFEIELFGKKYPLSFSLKNLGAIHKRFGISPYEVMGLLYKGDVQGLVACLWGGTLIFDEFDITNPLKIKEEIPIEELYNLNFSDLIGFKDVLTQALDASNPRKKEKDTEAEKKKKMTNSSPSRPLNG